MFLYGPVNKASLLLLWAPSDVGMQLGEDAYKSLSKQRLESSPPERKFHDTITKYKLKTFSFLKWGKCCNILLDLSPGHWQPPMDYLQKQLSQRSFCWGYCKAIRMHDWWNACGSEDKRWPQDRVLQRSLF